MANNTYVARLKQIYNDEIVKTLIEKYNYSSVMEVPHVEKIVINIGVGDATQNSKLLEDAVNELTVIAGQKPVITKAKKSIASFKLREGQAIGCKVTLRGNRMYEFLDKLVTISLPDESRYFNDEALKSATPSAKGSKRFKLSEFIE